MVLCAATDEALDLHLWHHLLPHECLRMHYFSILRHMLACHQVHLPAPAPLERCPAANQLIRLCSTLCLPLRKSLADAQVAQDHLVVAVCLELPCTFRLRIAKFHPAPPRRMVLVRGLVHACTLRRAWPRCSQCQQTVGPRKAAASAWIQPVRSEPPRLRLQTALPANTRV